MRPDIAKQLKSPVLAPLVELVISHDGNSWSIQAERHGFRNRKIVRQIDTWQDAEVIARLIAAAASAKVRRFWLN